MAGLLTFRFYGDLNDFLSRDRRQTEFRHPFQTRVSVKDVIESLGVPHTEVDLILVGGAPRGFAHIVRDGELISVYPVAAMPGRYAAARLQSPPPAPRFVLDVHLGRLAAYLRMLGFDALYRNVCGDSELAQLAASQRRILLSRDKGLLMRRQVIYGYFVRARKPHEQLLEVVARFRLVGMGKPFTRCMHCNGIIGPVSKDEVVERLLPGTREHYQKFWQCRACGRIYWQGSHYRRMEQLVARVSNRT